MHAACAACSSAAGARCAPLAHDFNHQTSQVRICEDAAVAYKVLTQSNHQGPPGSSECRCAAPYSNPAPSLSNVQVRAGASCLLGAPGGLTPGLQMQCSTPAAPLHADAVIRGIEGAREPGR